MAQNRANRRKLEIANSLGNDDSLSLFIQRALMTLCRRVLKLQFFFLSLLTIQAKVNFIFSAFPSHLP